jgi:hypothetical protein
MVATRARNASSPGGQEAHFVCLDFYRAAISKIGDCLVAGLMASWIYGEWKDGQSSSLNPKSTSVIKSWLPRVLASSSPGFARVIAPFEFNTELASMFKRSL